MDKAVLTLASGAGLDKSLSPEKAERGAAFRLTDRFCRLSGATHVTAAEGLDH